MDANTRPDIWIDDIAQAIRRHPNSAPTGDIAEEIERLYGDAGCADRVARLIDEANPDRTMGAGQLAEVVYVGLGGTLYDDEARQ